jgi:hypothetical protein
VGLMNITCHPNEDWQSEKRNLTCEKRKLPLLLAELGSKSEASKTSLSEAWIRCHHRRQTSDCGDTHKPVRDCSLNKNIFKVCDFISTKLYSGHETLIKKSCSNTKNKFKRKYWIYNSLCWVRNLAAGSKAWDCARSLAGIASSNPAGGDRCLFYECCVLSGRDLCVGLSVWVCVTECDHVLQ